MKRYQVWSDDAGVMVGTFEAFDAASALKEAHGDSDEAYNGNTASYRVSADGGETWARYRVRAEMVPEWSVKGGVPCDAPTEDDA